MFGLLFPDTVEFIDIRAGALVFLSKHQKRVGQTVRVRFLLSDTEATKLNLSVRILSLRRARVLKGFICVGLALVPEERFSLLETCLRSFASRTGLKEPERRSRRWPAGFRVRSRALADYRASTQDISLHGLRLQCLGPLSPGGTVGLRLDSELASVKSLELRGRVIWCQESSTSPGHSVGLELLEMSDTVGAALERLNHQLEARLRPEVDPGLNLREAVSRL